MGSYTAGSMKMNDFFFFPLDMLILINSAIAQQTAVTRFRKNPNRGSNPAQELILRIVTVTLSLHGCLKGMYRCQSLPHILRCFIQVHPRGQRKLACNLQSLPLQCRLFRNSLTHNHYHYHKLNQHMRAWLLVRGPSLSN